MLDEMGTEIFKVDLQNGRKLPIIKLALLLISIPIIIFSEILFSLIAENIFSVPSELSLTLVLIGFLVYVLLHYHVARQYVVFEKGIKYKERFYSWNDFNLIRESKFNAFYNDKHYVTFLKPKTFLGDWFPTEIIFIIPSEQLPIFLQTIKDRFAQPNWFSRNKNALLRSLMYVAIVPISYLGYKFTGDEEKTWNFIVALWLIILVLLQLKSFLKKRRAWVTNKKLPVNFV